MLNKMQNIGTTKNIPEPPKSPPTVHHKTIEKRESKSKSPRREIPKTFHEGHEKDIPDPKDFMEHNKFEKMSHIAEEHLGGPIEGCEKDKGLWEKTKEAVSSGIDSVKNLVSGKK
jgi:hypothetical protein